MNSLKEVFLAGYVTDLDINRLYHALIDVSVMVVGFDEGKRMYANRGICCLIETGPAFSGRAKKELDTVLTELFKSWDKYSGCESYPVPHPDMPAITAYNYTRQYNPHLMWGRLTPYGANRRELLIHCINEVSKLRLEIQNGLKPRIHH